MIDVVDVGMKDKLSRSLYNERQHQLYGAPANTSGRTDTGGEEIPLRRSISPGLPPASSDHRKWWLDHGMHPFILPYRRLLD